MFLLIIPANAGTQMTERCVREVRALIPNRLGPLIWVPAFAGMSGS
jgi:hypothetical protein